MAWTLASMPRRAAPPMVVLFAALALATPAEATIIEAVSLEELVQRSDHVVIGVVLAEVPHYDERGRIVTDVRIRVESSMKGSTRTGDELMIRRMGGVIGDIGMRVEGEPEFDVGDRRLLFLRDRSAYCRPVGMSQGVLPVRVENGQTWVESGTTGLALVRRNGVELVPTTGAVTEPVRLEAMIARIATLLSVPTVDEGPARDLR
jgi:hypothetical protein